MKDEYFFKIDEVEKINEFKLQEAEKYDTFENLSLKKEVFNPPETIDEFKDNTEKKKDSSSNDSIKRYIKQSSLTSGVGKIITSASSVVIGAAAAAIIITNAIYITPSIELMNFDYGSNCLAYSINIDDFDIYLDYHIQLSNNQEIVFDTTAIEGLNKERVYDLAPNTDYLLSVVAISNDNNNNKISYFNQSFTTYDSSYVSALFDVSITSGFVSHHDSMEEFYMFDIVYDIFVADVNPDNQYKLAFKQDTELYEENDEATNHLFTGKFTTSNPGNYVIEVWDNNVEATSPVDSYSVAVSLPDDLYIYNEYYFDQTISEVYIEGSLLGNTYENEYYQAVVNETLNDGSIKNYYYDITFSEGPWFSVIHNKDPLAVSISYKIILSNSNNELFRDIYDSSDLVVLENPNVNYINYTTTQDEYNQYSFNVNLTFDTSLTYNSYYIVDDGINYSYQIYTDNYTMEAQSLGMHTYYYQLFDNNSNALTERISFEVDVQIPNGKYIYEENDFSETIDDIIISGTILGNLADGKHYQAILTEQISGSSDNISYHDLTLDSNNTFTINYHKDIRFAYLSYEIVATDGSNYDSIHSSYLFEKSLTPSVIYEKQIITSNKDDNLLYDINFEFNILLPYGSYYIIDDGTVYSDKLYDHNYSISALASGEYTYYYQLFDINDNALTNKQEIQINTTAPSYGEYTLHTPNPSDIQVTYNDDGTINVYAITNFEDTSNSGIDYAVELYCYDNQTTYTYHGTSKIAYLENIPNQSYNIYYVAFVNSNNVAYEIDRINPSGGISTSNFMISCVIDDINFKVDFTSYVEIYSDLIVHVLYDDETSEDFDVASSSIISDTFTVNITKTNISTIKVSGAFSLENRVLEQVNTYLANIGKEIKGNLYYETEIICFS